MADLEWGTALAAAQGEMQNAPLNKVNPHFKNRYADLAAVRDATIPALSKHGLAINQTPQFDNENGFYLETKLIYKGAVVDTARYPVAMDLSKPQVMASSITYARRYSWSAMCGIASEEDDDAERGTGVKSSRQAKKDGDWELAGQGLIDEINSMQTSSDLRAFGIELQQRVAGWPEPFKQLIRDAFAMRLKDLGGTAGPPSKLHEDLRKSLEEVRAIDDGPIDVTTDDPQAFLDDLDSQMLAAKDEHTIMEVWKEYAGIKDVLSPADQAKAEMIWERHLRSTRASVAAKAMQDKKK